MSARIVETAAGPLPASVAAITTEAIASTKLTAEANASSASPPVQRGDSSIMRSISHWASVILPPLAVLIVAMVAWELATSGPKSSLPSPSRIWADSKDLIVDPFFVAGPQDIGLGLRVLTSLQRVAIGFGLAAVVGVLLGALVGQSVWAMRGLDPIFQVLRTVPPLAWLPISLAAFRDANPSAIFVIFVTAIWPIIINTATGIRNIPQDYRNVAAVLRLNQVEFFWRVMIPSAAPYIFTGLKIGIGLSWLAIVAAEMLTGGVGIGFFIWDAWNSSRLSDIIVALAYIGLVGFLLDRLVAAVGHFVTRGTQAS
jgi:nitrate/nitrite transport system permease protein